MKQVVRLAVLVPYPLDSFPTDFPRESFLRFSPFSFINQAITRLILLAPRYQSSRCADYTVMFNGILFQQSLQDLVKGIRSHRRDEEEYIRTKMAEIGDECRSSDITKKTTAILKLAYVCYFNVRPQYPPVGLFRS